VVLQVVICAVFQNLIATAQNKETRANIEEEFEALSHIIE
jgi:hypothetical protein